MNPFVEPAPVLGAIDWPVAFGWVVLVPPVGTAVTWLAGRLLGSRRGWVKQLASGLIGFGGGIIAAGLVTEWQWSSWRMIGLTLVFGTILTMVVAVGLDLIAPVGTLKRGEAAGLIGVGRKDTPSTIASLRRYRELVGIARRNGLLSERIDIRNPESIAAAGPDIRATLEQAGGVFVKLGQVASTRSDLLPPALCDQLALLRSQASPAPESEVRPLLEHELGTSVESVFADFDWTPIASASIAQVYAATDRDGGDVVVKVRRPGLDELMARDSGALMQLVRLVERRTTLGLTLRPADLADEFLAGVREELDLTVELSNAAALTAATPPGSGVRLPRMYPDHSTRMVLVEERVEGVDLGDVQGLRDAGHDPSEIAQRVLRVTLTHIFQAGVYHADPHPGNLIVEPDGTIVLIDLGAVGRLGKQQRGVLVQLMMGVAGADAAALRQALEQAGIVGDGVDAIDLDRAIDEFLARHVRAGAGIDAAVFEDLMVMLGDFGMRPPRWMTTLGRTFVTLEGTLRSVDPTFSLVDAAMADAGGILRPDVHPGTLRQSVEAEAMRQFPRLQRLPQRVDDLLGQAVQGRLSLRLSAFSDERDVDLVTTLVNRAVLALLTTALGLGSVLLLRIDDGGTEVSVNEVLGYTGLAVAAVLTLRIVANIVRDGRS
jgi:ubiquinone biosynthesis protein